MIVNGKIDLWWKIGRGYTIPQSIIPYLFGVALAAKQCDINVFLSILGLIGVVLVHMSINMLDDCYDWKKGAVDEYKKLLDKGMQARTHKCFYLEQNLVTWNQVFYTALAYDAIACVIGLYIAFMTSFSIVIIAALAGIMGFFYSAPPVKLSYRGLGELAIAIIFGPLLLAGVYITAGAEIDAPMLFSSVMLGIIISNIAFTHAIMDFDSDVKVGKTSFATLFKTKERATTVLWTLYVIAFFVLGLGIILGVFPLASILTFVVLPKTYGLIKLMASGDKEKKWWMGKIENWEIYQQEGSDWFMMRLCLSRNLVIDFILLLGLTYCLFG